ncbi:MAG: CvpA family protein [Myxococcota bacterium]
MWLDVLVLAILGWFSWVGVRRGGLAAGLGILTLVVSYGAAIITAPILASPVANGLDIPGVLGMPVAGSIAFAVAFVAMAILSKFVCRRADAGGDEGRSSRDRFLGGAFGAIRGAFVVGLLCYLALWVEALRLSGAADGIPALGNSAAAAVTSTVVEAGIKSALADSGRTGHVVARLAANPGVAVIDLQSVVSNPRVLAVQHDPHFWANVEAGAIGAALNTRSFTRLSEDEELRRQMASIGLIDQQSAQAADRFRAAVGDVLREVGPRIRKLRNDPELKGLLDDPEVVAMVENGDTLGLMNHPRFRRLVSRVASDPVID